jgi:hypothetical protein
MLNVKEYSMKNLNYYIFVFLENIILFAIVCAKYLEHENGREM